MHENNNFGTVENGRGAVDCVGIVLSLQNIAAALLINTAIKHRIP